MAVAIVSGYGYSNLFLVIGSVTASYPDDTFQMVIMGVFGLLGLIYMIVFMYFFMKSRQCKLKLVYVLVCLLLQSAIYATYYFNFY